jgi:ABC-type sulfate transport system permease subunit
VAVVGVLIVIPVIHVFVEALADGVGVYWKNLVADPDTRHSILLTLTVVPLARRSEPVVRDRGGLGHRAVQGSRGGHC